MGFPDSVEGLKLCGYKYQRSAECRGCQAPIDWYVTPAGKKIPMNQDTAKPHWATCTVAGTFRRKAKA